MAEHPLSVVPKLDERHAWTRAEAVANNGQVLDRRRCAKKCDAHAWKRKRLMKKHVERQRLKSDMGEQLVTNEGGEAAQEEKGGRNLYASSAIASSRARQDVAHQAQVRTHLYHKLGRLERGGAVSHSSASHL
ncbi:hypothetical protein TRVL_03795 [Trypanosoma vivax]|nr:hypothetical protein TRVL_03795 [Trypanosoma vivax]